MSQRTSAVMAATGPRTTPEPLYGGASTGRRVTVRDIAAANRFLKETGAHAVKLEGGERVARQVEDLVAAGIPVMAHLGLTPQSVNAFGGYRVQGRGEDGEHLLHDAKVLQAAGAFSVVLECVP